MIDTEMQSQERLKQQRLTFKSQVDDMESEISEVRKKLSTEQKEIAAMQKSITSLETKLEQKRADRHSLLKSCKVNAVFFGFSLLWLLSLSYTFVELHVTEKMYVGIQTCSACCTCLVYTVHDSRHNMQFFTYSTRLTNA
jgi:hypothetical protein